MQTFIGTKLFKFDYQCFKPIDLSSNNPELATFDTTSSKEWEQFMDDFLIKNHVKVAFGGYLEERNLYDRSSHFNQQQVEKRNIHLGIDFWCKVNSPIYAPFAGTIHSFQNNQNFGDYGPTIILEHDLNTQIFYTLYGHLSLKSIENLEIGKQINEGEIIGYLGASTVNGDYAPHLHFQIIKDLQNNFGDYPGVCSKKDVEFYKQNCLNPLNFLIQNM